MKYLSQPLTEANDNIKGQKGQIKSNDHSCHIIILNQTNKKIFQRNFTKNKAISQYLVDQCARFLMINLICN